MIDKMSCMEAETPWETVLKKTVSKAEAVVAVSKKTLAGKALHPESIVSRWRAALVSVGFFVARLNRWQVF